VETTTGNSVKWATKLLEEVQTEQQIWRVLKSSARGAVNADGVTVVSLEGGQCHYLDEDAMSPLWKGQHFPVTSCISGWAMLNVQTAVVPDIQVDSRIPQEAYRPTFVRSLAMVPITLGASGVAVGAIGAYWARLHHASADEVAALERLAAAAGAALQRVPASASGTTISRPAATAVSAAGRS
jgi:GAF domain-containing protein